MMMIGPEDMASYRNICRTLNRGVAIYRHSACSYDIIVSIFSNILHVHVTLNLFLWLLVNFLCGLGGVLVVTNQIPCMLVQLLLPLSMILYIMIFMNV